MPEMFIGMFVATAIISISIMILMGIYVYRDASQFDMSPVLWVVVVLLVPNFLGLIIYLIVRSGKKKEKICMGCGKGIDREFLTCPYCNKAQVHNCPSCGEEVRDDFKICPKCSEELEVVLDKSNESLEKSQKKIVIAIVVLIVGSMIAFGAVWLTFVTEIMSSAC